jgi:hypothetical protein
MNTMTLFKIQGRYLICALAACLLTVVLMGGIGHATVQAAQRAVLLQA